MNHKRMLSLLLALAIWIGILSGITLPAKAVTSAEDVDYVVTNDGYIYNWGTQGELATFLSPNAQTYYQENGITYGYLAALSGGTSQSNAPSSALYKALQKLMTDTHTSYTNYEDTKPLYAYTDTQNSKFGKLYCVYCVGEMTSAWNSGNIWQREHTWPKSKSLNGNSAFEQYGYNDETDIMMLRACHAQENMDRSNTAYGKSSNYFYPNLTSADVRGDVARTMLYGYVRWGNTSYMWGTSGVMENMNVLLEWMEADPVDTWEMGRNDSVEAINGNRNVFIDYPELAFLMFGKSVPTGMPTPQGSSTCEHEDSSPVSAKPATCTAPGNTAGRYCNDCFIYYDGYTVIPQLEHNWVSAGCTGGSVCTLCGEEKAGSNLDIVTSPKTGTAYKLGIDKKDGVIRYFSGSTDTTNYYLAATTNPDEAMDVYLESASGGYRMYFMKGSTKTYIRYYHYSGTSAGKGKGRVALTTTAPSEILTFDSTAKTMVYKYSSSNSYYMGTYGTYTNFSVSNTSYITGSNAANVDVTQYPARFYQATASGSHSWKAATCTAPKTCTACGATEGNALGHSWKNATCTTPKTCTTCGATEGSMLGHSWQAATCTVPKTCSTCGATEGSATGHVALRYVDNKDNTHDQVCACGHVVIDNEKHSYVDNVCVCGHGLLNVETAATLKAMLQLDFIIDTADLTGTDNYAIITRTYADGSASETIRVDQKDWVKYGTGTKMQASYTNIAAKEMGDEVTVIFYNAAGQPLTAPKGDSIKAYAFRGLAALKDATDAKNQKLRTVLVDMLNYGAAAQTYFAYDTADLVNKELTNIQKAWATQTDVTVENHRVMDEAGYGSTLTLKSAIQLDFLFYKTAIGTDFAGMYAVATYTDHYGKPQSVTVEGKDFTYYDTAKNYPQISVVDMAVADYQSLVTCTVYDAAGKVVAVTIDSMESYVRRALDSGRAGAELEDLGKKLMKFSAAADAYFQ